MDKLAQKRSLRSRVWENVNLTGKALESMHPELAEVMETMRALDEEIRNVAEDVKPLIRQAKSALRQRDYLNAAYNIVGFHSRVKYIAHVLGKFSKNVNLKHYKYLLDQFEDPYKEQLLGYDPNQEIKEACEAFDSLIKEAGVYDWTKEKFLNTYDFVGDTASNVITDKGRVRRLMEKRFSTSFMKELKTRTGILIVKSEKMMRELLSIFNALESGVSRRNIPLYEAKSKEFVSKFNNYHKIFEDYHKNILVPLKAHQDEVVRKEQEKEYQEVEEAKKSPLVTPHPDVPEPPPPTPSSPPSFPSTYKEQTFEEWKKEQEAGRKNEVLDKLQQQHGKEQFPMVGDVIPKDKTITEHVLDLEKDDVQDKKSHRTFLNQITVYANNEQVGSFIQELLNYSEVLENTDPNTSSELLGIANSVMEEYKTAGIFDFFKGKGTPTVEEGSGNTNPTTVPESSQQELGSQPQLKKKDKPQELLDKQRKLYRPTNIDMPEGRVDQAYTDINFLATKTPDQIRITPPGARMVIDIFAKRLINVFKIKDFEPYMASIEKKLIPTLKQSVYDGWVLSSDSVPDTHNPRDKFITVYTRLNLSNVDSRLQGIAKLHVSCRLSADQGTVTIRNIAKHFPLEVTKSQPLTQPLPEEDKEYEDDRENDLHGEFNDQFDLD